MEPFDLTGSALPAQDFNDALRAIPAKRLLVFIDACHAEGMATAKDPAQDPDKTAPPLKLPPGFAKSAPPADLLDALQEGEGRAVFTSSRGHQSSWVRTDGSLSIFTHHLLEALQGAASRPGDTVVRLSHLMNHLDKTVPRTARQMANAEQRPFVNLASEDFPVALLLGGKGLPAGGWPAAEQQVRRTIDRLIHVEGDRNVVAESISDSVIQTGDSSVATSNVDTTGGTYVAGNVDVAQGDFIGRDQVVQGDYVKGDKVEGDKVEGDKVENKTVFVGEDKQALRAQARLAYLKRLRNRCQVLPMAAIGGEDGMRDTVRLDQLYVELDTMTPAIQQDERVEYGERQVRLMAENERKLLSAMEVSTQEARLALLGDPGGGKSTFVKQLAAWLIDAALGERQPPSGWSDDMLPLITNLRDLAPRLSRLALDGLSGEQRDQALIETLHAQWQADVESLPMSADPTMDVLEAALNDGAVLVVFDGLDEVPEGARKRVGWMLDALLSTYPDIKHVIVTCRVRSYVGDAVLSNFADHRLAPFDEEKIELFVQGWYQAQVDLGRLTPSLAEARRTDLAQAALTADLVELAQNPMLLTTMAVIHQRDVGLPKERVRLYHQAVTVLLHRWQRHRGLRVSEALGAVLADELKMRAIMERLAHDAHQQEVNEQGKLHFGGLVEVLSTPDYLGDLGLVGEFLTYVDEKAGVLVGEGGSEAAGRPPTYTFPHRTFQEYLAGCYLVGGRPSARRLRPYAEAGDFWYLAAQLAGEELLYNRRNETVLLDLMYDLCPAIEPTNERDWRTALWSGQTAKLIGPAEVAKDQEPGGGQAYLDRLTQRLVSIVDHGLLTPPERADAGRILSVLGDPRPGTGVVNGLPDIVWCDVPAGEFMMGDNRGDSDEQPAHKLTLSNFRLAKYPITNAQYAVFVEATNRSAPSQWEGNTPPVELANHPVVNVTWRDAIAFCAWLSEQLGETVRLPSEAEWEKAARGDQGSRRYPWGDDEPDEDRCNFDNNIGTTTSVGLFPAGNSPYHCCDMSGNVWEWTGSLWGKDFSSAEFGYPYDPTDGRENLDAPESVRRVLRGGAFTQLSSRRALRLPLRQASGLLGRLRRFSGVCPRPLIRCAMQISGL